MRENYAINVLGHKIYFIFGAQNIARLRKYPRTITTPGATTYVLKTLFGMAHKAIDMYNLDNSGVHPAPSVNSHVAVRNRVDYLTHANFHKHLLGDGLNDTYHSFMTSFARRLPSLEISTEWSYHPDLNEFWLPSMTSAMNEALAGPIIECVNPNFTSNLLEYYPYVQELLKGYPFWGMFKARRLQKRLIEDVKIWHAIARARFHEGDIDPATGRDPWWGSAFMRERQEFLTKIDNWDANAVASSDFGIFWG